MAADRQDIETKLIVEGRPLLVKLINNPTIDDVVVTEARVYLASLDGANVGDLDSRVVPRDIRDFLIRIGVER